MLCILFSTQHRFTHIPFQHFEHFEHRLNILLKHILLPEHEVDMQQKMILISFFVFEMVYGAPMSDFNPEFLFKVDIYRYIHLWCISRCELKTRFLYSFCLQDNLNGPSINEYREIQTTAVPDLPEFLFKQFGEPPLTDNQILALLIGRNRFLKVFSSWRSNVNCVITYLGCKSIKETKLNRYKALLSQKD